MSEGSVERSLGRLEAGLDGILRLLEEHTANDTANFERLEEHILRVEAALTAGASGGRAGGAAAARWGAGAAAFVAGIAEAMRWLGGG